MDLLFVPSPSPHLADYIVIAIFLCICMGIGIYYGFKRNQNLTLENYFFGNRHLSLIPVAMSLFVTFVSAISLMGIPAEVYAYGIRIVYYAVSNVISVIIANFTVVPLLYPLKLSSIFEYLELRFQSKAVRRIGTMIGMLLTIMDMGVTLYAPSLALQFVAGIPLWVSIAVIGLVCTLYTTIGGIQSVVWTDAFQFVMIFIGLVAVTVKGGMLMETRHSVVGIANEGRRLDFINFDPDPRSRHTIWGTCVGFAFTFLCYWCNQSSFQRMSSLRSLRATKIAIWMLSPMIVVYFIFLGYLGIILYSYYNTVNCDPVESGLLTNFNQLMPYFVLDVLRSLPGLSGVYISCLFSGTLSTLSSGINALSAITVEEILGSCLHKSKTISQTFVGKLLVSLYGLGIIGLAYGISSMSGSVIQIFAVVTGACGAGPLAGLFFLGGMTPKANWIGAVIGSVTALVCNIWIALGALIYGKSPSTLPPNPTSGCFARNITNSVNDSSMYIQNTTNTTCLYDVLGYSSMSPNVLVTPDEGFFLYNVSYIWYGFIGFFLTLIIGIAVSLCTSGFHDQPVEAQFIFPLCRKMCSLEPDSTYEETDSENQNVPPMYPEQQPHVLLVGASMKS
ncbi:sodium-coupled monocarboxylate transporter 2-like [Ylistrum balloti]|uniref:sodium-coupled monocarboxylate transporter 2-like n=1 Tax=Ylistrum balloti TaxID=509963 RepID=UPI00290593B9|nr:sodium-coupled monocarboxylate transporter 2-like [Ylistrum balloti]